MSLSAESVRFSVIIVSRNRCDQLRCAIESCLDLDYPPDAWELVVVDNGSSDGTSGMLRSYEGRLTALNEPKAGIGNARNRGATNAQGQWLLYLDDDALVPRDLLRHYEQWTNRCPEALAWGGGARLVYPDRLPWCWGPAFDGMLSALDLGLEPERLNFPQTPYGLNMLIQRDRLRALGGFRPEIRFGGDETDLFLRMHEAGDEIRYAPGCMVTHCVTADRFSIRWLLGAAFRSGGYHAWLDLLNGRRFIGWRMISSGFVMVLLGRRGCVPVSLAMHALRIAGYAKVRWRGVAP